MKSLFKKKKENIQKLPHRGEIRVVSGRDAIRKNGGIAGAIVSPGMALGLSLTGWRGCALVEKTSITEFHKMLFGAVGKHAPFPIHLFCRAITKQAYSKQGGHEDYHAISDTGLFQLFAKNVQEASDFSIIAHRIAELSLNTGICALDARETGDVAEPIFECDEKLIETYLGNPQDFIESPTPAQRILFGENRRRIPEIFDLDQPLGIGGEQEDEIFYKAQAAQRVFFFDHAAELIDRAMKEFGTLTGRYYERAFAYRTNDAEYVIAAQGNIVVLLEKVVDYLRKYRKIKAGVLNLSVFRPFPGDIVSRLLKEKKGVSILERVDQPLAAELPLFSEIQSALDNHQGKLSIVPALYSGIYGLGGRNPSPGELVAVYENMVAGGEKKRHYYLGIKFQKERFQLPKIEILQESITAEYPNLPQLSLLGSGNIVSPDGPGSSFQMMLMNERDGTAVALTLANVLTKIFGFSLRMIPFLGEALSFKPMIVRIEHRMPEELKGKMDPGGCYATIVDESLILQNESLLDKLIDKGLLLFMTDSDEEKIKELLSLTLKKKIISANIAVVSIDADKIALEIDPAASAGGAMSLYAMIGAFLELSPLSDAIPLTQILAGFKKEFQNGNGNNGDFSGLSTKFLKALERGASEFQRIAIELPSSSGEKSGGDSEVEAPWPIKEKGEHDGSLFDPLRFWDTIGFPYAANHQSNILPDPYLATAVMPAGTSTLFNLAPYRRSVPALIPENCNGCGLCFTCCPDSALPSTLQSVSQLLEAALQLGRKKGIELFQLERIKEHLGKMADRMVASDGLQNYITLGPLLMEAFVRLTDKMGLKDEKLKTLQDEFDSIIDEVEFLPLVKTEKFYSERNEKAKGSGLLLSILVDPKVCKECGLCVAVCPEKALEMVEQKPEILERYKQNINFNDELPEVSQETLSEFVSEQEPDSLIYYLLNKIAYNSITGGDRSFPGSGGKIAMHIVAAACETFMRPRVESSREKILSLINGIEKSIQGQFSETLNINDFEKFGKRLNEMKSENITLTSLAEIIQRDDREPDIDSLRLKRLNEILTELKKQPSLYEKGLNINARARMSAIIGDSDYSFLNGVYPYNSFLFPWIYHNDAGIDSVAKGIYNGIIKKMSESFKAIRIAALELDGVYDSKEHDIFFKNFSSSDFSDDETSLCPPFFVIGGANSMIGKGSSGLFSLIAEGLPVKIIILESINPFGEPDLLPLMWRNAFVLHSTIGFPGHLFGGIMEGLAFKGPAIFRIYAPEPREHEISSLEVFKQARLAVESRTFPLFKYKPEPDKDFGACFDLTGNPDPRADWALRPASNGDSASELLTPLDWAGREGRFKRYFIPIGKGENGKSKITAAEYFKLPAEKRSGLKVTQSLLFSGDKNIELSVSKEMIAFAEKRLHFWRFIKELAGVSEKTVLTDAIGAAGVTELEQLRQQLEEKEELIQDLELRHGQLYLEKLKNNLLQLCGNGDAENLQLSLRELIKINKDGNG